MGRFWKYLKETPTWTWLALFLISGIVTTAALRHNNFEMIHLRDSLYAADKNGQNVDQALNNLRGYVYAHMNTNLASGGNAIHPPIQLKYTYDRLVKTEQQRVDTANDQIFRDAQSYCRVHQPGKFRQVCFEDYTKQHNVKAKAVLPALYQFDFASPSWSPDLAGWSLVVSILLGISTIVSLLADRWVVARYRRFRRKRA